MKTAIAIDSLMSRDETTILLELVLGLFPHSEIYTLVHHQGGILGRIETRPIVSSFLTHLVKKGCGLEKQYWIIPSASKALPLHSSIEKIIILSRGYIHGLKIPQSVEKFLYIIDWDIINPSALGWQKFFRPFVDDWRKKSLQTFNHISVSSNELKNRLHLSDAKVIYPTYRTEDYTFVKDEDHNFHFTHHLIYTHGVHLNELDKIISFLVDHEETVKVLGPDSHLTSLKNKFHDVEFVGDHCEATQSLYTHQAKVVWDLSQLFFPSRALGANASGRPVVVRQNLINKEVLKYGVYFLEQVNQTSLSQLYSSLEDSYLGFDRKVLRRQGLKFNERLFKSRLARFIQNT